MCSLTLSIPDDASAILLNQLKVWWVHGHLYINELMVKKMSLLGAAVLVLAMNWQGEQRRTSQVAGLLLEKAENVMSDQKSIVMLVGRLLMWGGPVVIFGPFILRSFCPMLLGLSFLVPADRGSRVPNVIFHTQVHTFPICRVH